MDEIIALRREIHRHPELAGQERRTAGLVAESLRAAGLEVTTGVGGHGVVAVLDAGDGPTVGYRADLDAVADTEASGVAFASGVRGAAHLCGHDVHTAVGVGLAVALAAASDRVPGRVVFYFQPAEENLEGARDMLADGVLDRLPPREVYALHCAPLPVGTFGVMPGLGLPGLDTGHVDAGDPAAAARLAAAIEALSTVTPPASPAEYERLVSGILVPDGPLARFVYAGAAVEPPARVRFWVRAWPWERHAEVRDAIRRLAGGAAVELPAEPFPAMVCDPGLSRAAVPHLGETVEAHAMVPFNGEDFALFLQRVPGAMFWLGVGPDGNPHQRTFVADERAVGAGVAAMSRLLLARLAVR